jgi:hypothetical protein
MEVQTHACMHAPRGGNAAGLAAPTAMHKRVNCSSHVSYIDCQFYILEALSGAPQTPKAPSEPPVDQTVQERPEVGF